MIKVITSMSILKTPEGKRLAYTYSMIDEITGQIVESNKRESFAIVDPALATIATDLENYILNR